MRGMTKLEEPINVYGLCRTIYELNELPTTPSAEAINLFKNTLFPASTPGQNFNQPVKLPTSGSVEKILKAMFAIDGYSQIPNGLSTQLVYSAL